MLKPAPITRSEALGCTGMIYGEEYGSFYLAPTSMHNENINFSLTYCGYIIGSRDLSIKGTFFSKTKVGNFSLGYYNILFYTSLPILYSLNMYNFSLGISLAYNSESFLIKHKYLLSNISMMYKSSIGNFCLALNNNLLKVFSDSDNTFKNINSLKPDLRIGYGKEFNLGYLFDKVQIAVELNNVLMNSLYINGNTKDYSIYNKLHLGLEFFKKLAELKPIEEVKFPIILSARIGMKNLFPTFGICLELFESIKFEYTLANNIYSTYNKLTNIFSLEFRLANILWEKVLIMRKHQYLKLNK